MPHFDLVVLGSGSGNSVINPHMRDWQIAIVEESTFGGTCLNVGCIPTKMYVYAADVARSVRGSARYGIDSHVDAVRWPAIRDRIFGRIDPISAGGRSYRAHSPNVTLYEGHAEFTGPRTLRVSGPSVPAGGEASTAETSTAETGTVETITADRIVIATGSRATVPEVVTASGVPFQTSDTVMRLPALPRRMAILGGGYIAAEFAHVFSSLGVAVSVITRSGALLRQLDEQISAHFTALAQQVWDVHLNAMPHAVSGDTEEVRLDLADGTTVVADVLLVATGRRPNTDRLGLAAAGVRVDDDQVGSGLVEVDEYQRTNVEGVWALGDVSSADQLKHVANQDARVVAHNLTHPDALRRSNHDFIPSAVFTHPQIASVGASEQELRARGVRYVAKVQRFGDTAYGWAMEDTSGLCKLLADPATGLLLGAHIIGPQASSLVQPLIQAMAFGQRVQDVAANQYWIHPALTEVVENALLGLDLI